jgi:long-chain fatty acid transport protein
MLARRLSILAFALIFPVSGWALGIRLFDHDAFATARGDAFVATADNPSAIYYNPAGITLTEGHNARAGVNLLGVEATYDRRDFREIKTDNDLATIPGFFYTYAPSNLPFALGVGYYLPYGLALDWPENNPFRTTTIHGELEYHTFSGVAAWKPFKSLSVAAGPTFNYACVDLRRGIALPGDSFKFNGSDYDWGATAGLLWQPFTKHSFGLSYRSETMMTFEGKSRVAPYPVPVQNASTELPFPQVIIVGYSFRPTPNWNFEVDIDWTDWDSVNTPVLKQKTGNVPLPLRWKSSWAIEAGATRYFDNGMHVSAGYVYLENSVPENSFNPLVPDQDLHVFSAGVGGRWKRLSWDATYQFTYGPGRDVSHSVYGATVNGHYTFVAHAFSLSLGWHF